MTSPKHLSFSRPGVNNPTDANTRKSKKNNRLKSASEPTFKTAADVLPVTKLRKSAPGLHIPSVKPADTPLPVFPSVDDTEVPRVTIWKPFTKEVMKDIIYFNQSETLNAIEAVLPPDFSLLNKHFLKTLLFDILRWSIKHNLDGKKTSSLLGMYLNTHCYFLGSNWRNQDQVYKFFKESILLHSIQQPPKSVLVFKEHECRSGLIYFCHTYLPVLPLIRVQLLPNYQLKLQWAQSSLPKEQNATAKERMSISAKKR